MSLSSTKYCSLAFKGTNFLVDLIGNDYFGGEAEIMDKYWNINRGDVVIDCGAATGMYSIPALALGARVYAFDAHPAMCTALQKNVELNHFDSRCNIHNKGLFNSKPRHMSLVDALTAHGAPRALCESVLGIHVVQFVSLDYIFWNNIDKISFIKVDVESYELDVLQGAYKIINKYHPRLLVENHHNVEHLSTYMQSNNIWSQILRFVKNAGYKKLEETPYEGRSFLYAEF